MQRLFIATEIGDAFRKLAASHSEMLKRKFPGVRVSWVRPENLHITLKFLGDVEPERVERLMGTLAAIAAGTKPIQALPGRPAAFGKRTLVIGVRSDEFGLDELGRIVDLECCGAGFEREERTFKPHITIGRIREVRGAGALIALHRNTHFDSAAFEISSVTLFESTLRPTGSIYIPLARAQFRS